MTTSVESTSISLLGRATAGDSSAWQRIVQLYGPLVYSWSRRCGLQPSDAADATQETFAAVAKRLPAFDHTRRDATFRGWLWTIARNKAADLMRKQLQQPAARGGSTNLQLMHAVSQTGDLSSQAAERSAEEFRADEHEVLRRALAIMRTNFEPKTWQAFWRTVVDGLTPDEVATELSISRWAVYKARSRVLHALRSELEGLEDID